MPFVSHFTLSTCALFAALWFSLLCPGQISQAGLQGTVKDNTGALVPGATVVLKNRNTGHTRTVSTGQSGEYVIPNLNPGEYSLTVTMQGFKTSAISSLRLHTGEQSTVDTTLELGATSQEVTVEAVVPMLSTASSEVNHLVPQSQVSELPLTKRPQLLGTDTADSGRNLHSARADGAVQRQRDQGAQ